MDYLSLFVCCVCAVSVSELLVFLWNLQPGSQSDSRNKNLPLFLLILKVMYWNRALNYLASEAIASPQDKQNKADRWNPNTKNKTLLLRSTTS